MWNLTFRNFIKFCCIENYWVRKKHFLCQYLSARYHRHHRNCWQFRNYDILEKKRIILDILKTTFLIVQNCNIHLLTVLKKIYKISLVQLWSGTKIKFNRNLLNKMINKFLNSLSQELIKRKYTEIFEKYVFFDSRDKGIDNYFTYLS